MFQKQGTPKAATQAVDVFGHQRPNESGCDPGTLVNGRCAMPPVKLAWPTLKNKTSWPVAGPANDHLDPRLRKAGGCPACLCDLHSFLGWRWSGRRPMRREPQPTLHRRRRWRRRSSKKSSSWRVDARVYPGRAQTVNVVSSDQIERLNVRNFNEIQSLLPGLTLSGGGSYSTAATVRGVAFNPEASGNNPTVEFYLNDTPIASNFLFQSTFDVGQLELLRGPQGYVAWKGRRRPARSR